MSEAKKHTEKKEQPINKNLRYQRDKDREKVRGIFKFYEVPGGGMSFVYRAYKEDQVERFDLIDGEIYTLPLGVAKHLNKNGWYPEYEFIKGESGTQGAYAPSMGSSAPSIMRVGKKVRRFGFQSLEFVDLEDLTQNGKPVNELVTVEQVL